MSLNMRKRTVSHERLTKTQISCASAQSDQRLRCLHVCKKKRCILGYPQMRPVKILIRLHRLIWNFAGRTFSDNTMKIPRKCHNHKARGIKRSRDEEHIRTTQCHIRNHIRAIKENLQQKSRLGMVSRKTGDWGRGGGGGGGGGGGVEEDLNQFYSCQTSPHHSNTPI